MQHCPFTSGFWICYNDSVRCEKKRFCNVRFAMELLKSGAEPEQVEKSLRELAIKEGRNTFKVKVLHPAKVPGGRAVTEMRDQEIRWGNVVLDAQNRLVQIEHFGEVWAAEKGL